MLSVLDLTTCGEIKAINAARRQLGVTRRAATLAGEDCPSLEKLPSPARRIAREAKAHPLKKVAPAILHTVG